MTTPHIWPLGAPDLFTSFWLKAHWVWERRKAAKRAGLPFSEETITDTVLLDLASENPTEIAIFAFNKREEGKFGADWEWCFYDAKTNRFFTMLVQAKLLDDLDQEYSHIDRHIGSTGVTQIDRLIETSARRNVPAIYALYNHLDNPERVPVTACSCFECVECWGCSVMTAEAVRALLPKKDFDTLRMFSRPWVCLLCREETKETSAPDRVLAALRYLSDLSDVAARESGVELRAFARLPEFPSDNPPSYFNRLRRIAGETIDVERQVILAQVAAENPGVDGIVLVTNRR